MTGYFAAVRAVDNSVRIHEDIRILVRRRVLWLLFYFAFGSEDCNISLISAAVEMLVRCRVLWLLFDFACGSEDCNNLQDCF